MKKRFLTGMRPTNRLTIGNYLGGIKPLLAMQELGEEIYLFVATLHGLTDNEPSEIMPNVINIVGDYVASGVNPSKVAIYNQFDIRHEVMLITGYLNREVSTARLLRLPTLKDKVRGNEAEHANAALLTYPTLMATDIVCQDATHVPVGKDQKPHLELTRELVRSFNRKYGSHCLVSPQDYDETGESINILSLRGNGKMSKTNPDGALFLYDSMDTIVQKIKKAETGNAGKKSEKVESMLQIAQYIIFQDNNDQYQRLHDLYQQHLQGDEIMGVFKKLFTEIIIDFTVIFQKNRRQLRNGDIQDILSQGAQTAQKNATQVRERMEKGMQV